MLEEGAVGLRACTGSLGPALGSGCPNRSRLSGFCSRKLSAVGCSACALTRARRRSSSCWLASGVHLARGSGRRGACLFACAGSGRIALTLGGARRRGAAFCRRSSGACAASGGLCSSLGSGCRFLGTAGSLATGAIFRGSVAIFARGRCTRFVGGRRAVHG